VYPNYEVIVVDNASQDGSREFLEAFAASRPGVRLILNDANEGFARANNRGMEAAKGDYLVLLNNDTVVTRGWLARLIFHLRDPQVGLVGPVTNWSANESRIEVDYRTLEEMEVFADSYTVGHEGQTFDIPMLLFFCVALRRSVYERVGPLDEQFGLGLVEDRDYASRVKLAGWRVVCAEDVFVHHYGNASMAKLGRDGYARLFERNKRLYEQKWGAPWPGHQRRT
jgi:GT2 family glycosyltransferase